MRLIELDAALDVLQHSIEDECGELQSYAEAVISDAEDAIKALPTVDAVPMDDVLALATALSKEIEVLGLSTRTYNALSRLGWCHTVGDVYRLLKSGGIKKIWNIGDKSIGDIEDRLREYLPYLWQTEGRWNGTAEKTEKTV